MIPKQIHLHSSYEDYEVSAVYKYSSPQTRRLMVFCIICIDNLYSDFTETAYLRVATAEDVEFPSSFSRLFCDVCLH